MDDSEKGVDHGQLILNDQVIEQVQYYIPLGGWLIVDNDSSEEI